MAEKQKTMIEVGVTVNAPLVKVWKYFTAPGHITKWYFALDEWHVPSAVNDLKPGGRFSIRMEAKDRSAGFDFWGTYLQVKPLDLLDIELGDGRAMTVYFIESGDRTIVNEVFEAEGTHTPERQKTGWQAILENFKKYAEGTLETCS